MTEPAVDPHETAVLIFAHFLGIDIETEHHLLYIAQDALSPKGLPKGWELGIGDGDNDGIPYFFNTITEESVWNHPKEDVFKRKVNDEREKDKRKAANEAQKAKKRGDGGRPSSSGGTTSSNASRPSTADGTGASGGTSTAVPTKKEIEYKEKERLKETEKEKEEPGFEVMEFEDVEPFSPEPKSESGGKGATFNTNGLTNSGNSGVVTANRSSVGGFAMQATDFYASDTEDTAAPGVAKAEAITATTTTHITNTKTGGVATLSSPGPKKSSKPGSGSSSGRDNWASGGQRQSGSVGNNKAKDLLVAPPSPGNVSRITGPPVSSRSQDQDRDRPRDRDRDRPSTANAALGGEDVRRSEREIKEREREKDAREKESREREREREIREKEEARRREREMRERDRGPALHGRELEVELAAERRRTNVERRRGDVLDAEVASLREKCTRIEEQLEDEKRDRRETEERVYRLQSDIDERLRDTTEKWEERVREASRGGRQEIELEWRERMKSSDRRHEEDFQIAREEVRVSKARTEEALKEIDTLRRRVSQSHDDGKLEAQLELEKLRNEVESLEAKARAQGLELRRLREDHVDVGSRLAVALQSAQIAQAESEAAKSQAASIVAEGKSSHTALVQATNRIQSIDGECAKLKAENLLHRREIDAQQAELRKLQAAAGSTVESINAQESTHRRARAQAESEVARLTSKLSEQEAVLEVLRSQLDKAQDAQSNAIHDVEKQLDRSIFDVHRLRESVRELDAKNTNSITRVVELEKQLIVAQDSTFRAERALREEQQRQQLAAQRLEQQRATSETELSVAREETHQSHLALREAEAKHRSEMEALKREVSERIPKISQAVVERLEGQFQNRVDSELNSLQARNDSQMQGLKRELLELQVQHAEKDARQRAAVADERAELERLKVQNGRQQKQITDLETDLDDALLAVRRGGGRALLMDAAVKAQSSAEEKVEAALNVSTTGNNYVAGLESQATEAESFQAVSQLQGQLVWMKQQLNLALDSTTDKKMQRALGEQNSFASPGFVRFRSQPHVSFSPESLFQSPNPISSNKSRGGTGASIAGSQRPNKNSTAPRSVFDHIRFQDGDGDKGGDEGDDNNLPYGSGNNESAINRSQVNFETTDIGDTRKSSAYGGRGADDEVEFEGIQDGGFHAGYWKARYAKGGEGR